MPQAELNTINEILKNRSCPPIELKDLPVWDIFGGESFDELHECAACIAGECHQSEIQSDFYRNSRYL